MSATFDAPALANPVPVRSGDSSGANDAIRGVLMIAIVLGHSRLLFENIQGFMAWLYFWHVQGFFFLAFGRRGFAVADRRIGDTLVRYLTPFAIVVTLLSAVHAVTAGTATAAHDWWQAMLFGTARLVQAATGLQLFWFLPTLAGLVTAMILISRLIARVPPLRRIGPALLAAWLVATWFVPRAAMPYLPLGLALIGYLLALASLHAAAMRATERGRTAKAAIAAGAIAVIVAQGIAIAGGGNTNIAVFVFSKPDALGPFLLAAAGAVAANILVFLVAPQLSRSRIVIAIGRRSMDVFLVHQFIQFPLARVAAQMLGRDAPLWAIAATGMAVSMLALLGSMLASLLLDRLGAVRAILLPRDLPSLIASLRGLRRRPGARIAED